MLLTRRPATSLGHRRRVGAGLAPALLKKEADFGFNTRRLAGRKDAEKGRGGGCFYAQRRPYRGYLRWLHARRDSCGRYAPRAGGSSRRRRLGQKYAQARSGPVDGWPGVTDGVTGVANAFLANSPILVIGGAAPLGLWDRGALQEMNQIDLLRPITKWARTVHETSRLGEYTAAAFRQMLSGKPGPVFLEMPMDILNNFADTDTLFDPGEPENYRAGGRTAPDPEMVEKAAAVLAQAQRPVIMAGTAVWWCDAAEPLRQLAERIQAPVFLNGAGRGCLPPTHPLFFTSARRKALEGSDTILAIGTRMDFRLN